MSMLMAPQVQHRLGLVFPLLAEGGRRCVPFLEEQLNADDLLEAGHPHLLAGDADQRALRRQWAAWPVGVHRGVMQPEHPPVREDRHLQPEQPATHTAPSYSSSRLACSVKRGQSQVIGDKSRM